MTDQRISIQPILAAIRSAVGLRLAIAGNDAVPRLPGGFAAARLGLRGGPAMCLWLLWEPGCSLVSLALLDLTSWPWWPIWGAMAGWGGYRLLLDGLRVMPASVVGVELYMDGRVHLRRRCGPAVQGRFRQGACGTWFGWVGWRDDDGKCGTTRFALERQPSDTCRRLRVITRSLSMRSSLLALDADPESG